MNSSSSATFSLIPIFHGLWVIKHSKTPITDSNPHRDFQLLVTFITYEFELDHVIPSLLGYILVVPILTMLPGPSSRSKNFDGDLILRRSSSSYQLSLKNKLDFEFVSHPWFQELFASSFRWLDVIADRLHLLETSWQMCHDHHQHSEVF